MKDKSDLSCEERFAMKSDELLHGRKGGGGGGRENVKENKI